MAKFRSLRRGPELVKMGRNNIIRGHSNYNDINNNNDDDVDNNNDNE